MEKEFLSYSQALALKELGFDEPCFAIWCVTLDGYEYIYIQYAEITFEMFAPLYQQAFRWFREKKLADGSVCRHGKADGSYSYRWDIVYEYGVYEERHFKQDYKTYEEAQDACINKLIELIKDGIRN